MEGWASIIWQPMAMGITATPPVGFQQAVDQFGALDLIAHMGQKAVLPDRPDADCPDGSVRYRR